MRHGKFAAVVLGNAFGLGRQNKCGAQTIKQPFCDENVDAFVCRKTQKKLILSKSKADLRPDCHEH